MDNQDQLNQYGQQEEIDLVDVAVVVYRRKTPFFLTLFLCFVVSVGYWYIGNRGGNQSTVNQSLVSALFANGRILVGEKALGVVPMDVSEGLLTTRYIPQNLKKYASDTEVRLHLTGSTIALIASNITEGSEQLAISVLNSSLEDLLAYHNKQYDRFVSMSFRVPASEAWVAAAHPSQILQSATVASAKSSSSKKSFTLFGIGGIVFGMILGCVVVFILELLSKIKIRIAEAN